MNSPIGFFSIGVGGVLGIAGVTGSSLASVVQGRPDRKNATGLGSGAVSSTGAGTGVGSGTLGPVSAHGFAHPLPTGFTRGRTDMGIDYSASPGDRINVIGPARILGIFPNWYKGQPYVEYEVLGKQGELLHRETGTNKLYAAEQIVPTVHTGQVVPAGGELGYYASSGTGIEFGLAAGGGRTLAQTTTGYAEGQVTRAGEALSHFLARYGL